MAEHMNNFSGKEWLQHSFSIWRDINKNSEERKLKHPAMFPIQLAEKLIRIFTKDTSELILDPFAGVGSTLIAARNSQRKGIGFELSEEYCKITKQRLSEYQSTLSTTPKEISNATIFKHDSRLAFDKYLTKNSVDLCITSPPYWDILNQKRTVDKKEIKNYSLSEEDLGNITDYNAFLEDLKKVFSQVYSVLKPNKRCCVVVMDIRKKNKFYPFHIDLTKVMEEIGFELEEFVIWDRQH